MCLKPQLDVGGIFNCSLGYLPKVKGHNFHLFNSQFACVCMCVWLHRLNLNLQYYCAHLEFAKFILTGNLKLPLDSVAPVGCELNAAKILYNCLYVCVCVWVCVCKVENFTVFTACMCECVSFSHKIWSVEYFSVSVLKVLAHLINLLQPTSLYSLVRVYEYLTSPNSTMQYELCLNVFFMFLV